MSSGELHKRSYIGTYGNLNYIFLSINEHFREQHLKYLRHEIKPHVYATSASAYRGLRDFNRNQVIPLVNVFACRICLDDFDGIQHTTIEYPRKWREWRR